MKKHQAGKTYEETELAMRKNRKIIKEEGR